MEPINFNVPEEMEEYIDQVVWVSGTTAGVPILSKSEVCRAIFSAGFDAIQEGDVEIDDHDIREFEDFDGDINEIMEKSGNKGKQVTCHKCNYVWSYTGDLNKGTCPDCGAKVPVSESEEEQ